MVLNQLRDSTQQKMRNILFLSLEILEKELIRENSSANVNLALKIIQNYRINHLIDENIGSEDAKNVKKRLLKLKLSDEEIASRKKSKESDKIIKRRGYGKIFHESVLQADKGADFDFLRPVK